MYADSRTGGSIKFWHFNSGVTENSGLLGCDAVTLSKWLPMFIRNVGNHLQWRTITSKQDGIQGNRILPLRNEKRSRFQIAKCKYSGLQIRNLRACAVGKPISHLWVWHKLHGIILQTSLLQICFMLPSSYVQEFFISASRVRLAVVERCREQSTTG